MRVQVDDGKKLVAVWMTHADQADEKQQEELHSLFREYKAKNYTVAVFQSGQENLAALTGHLLCHNRLCAAKAELRKAQMER